METLENYNLFIITTDIKLNKESLRNELEKYINKTGSVHTFETVKSCIDALDISDTNPEIIVLDYMLSNNKNTLFAIDDIIIASPKSCVIIISEEVNMPSAIKILKYGAQEYVLKDQFLFQHLSASVKKCLQPSAV